MLTPVGILPIVLAGFDIRAMLKGAAEMEEICAKKCECNPAVQYAAMRNLLYNNGTECENLCRRKETAVFFGKGKTAHPDTGCCI